MKSEQYESGNDQNQLPGISAYFARVLDQISVSTWFPTAVLVGALSMQTAILLEGSFNLIAATTKLTKYGWVLLVCFLLASILMQPFNLACTRFLEGYWGSHPFTDWFTSRCIRRQVSRYKKTWDRMYEIQKIAFYSARKSLINHYGIDDTNALEHVILETDQADKVAMSPEIHRDWKSFVAPDVLFRYATIRRQTREYPPSRHLILPTKLGNIIVAAEKRGGDGWRKDVELSRNVNRLRDRVELYSALTSILAALALTGVIVLTLLPNQWWIGIVNLVLFLALSQLSYRAAQESACRYLELLGGLV